MTVADRDVYVWAAIDVNTFEVIHVEVSPGRSTLDALLFLDTVFERCRGEPIVLAYRGPWYNWPLDDLDLPCRSRRETWGECSFVEAWFFVLKYRTMLFFDRSPPIVHNGSLIDRRNHSKSFTMHSVNVDTPGDEVQLGWFIEAGTYPDIRERGIEWFRDQVAAVDPVIEDVLEEYLSDFDQCTLHPAPGMSDEWTQNGLLLIGDAAHVASPFGAQGNSLAIQDAVVAHSYIVPALREFTGPIQTDQLRNFEETRHPAVETVMEAQKRAATFTEFYVKHREDVPTVVWKFLFLGFLRLTSRFPPLNRRGVRLFAFGPNPMEVDTTLFSETESPTDSPSL